MVVFDLEDRTFQFSKLIINFCKSYKINFVNRNVLDQLLRSSTSVGANYLEANDPLGKKDFVHRLRIARKEAKETCYWLELLLEVDEERKDEILILHKEITEIKKILSSIISKSKY